MAVYSGSRTNDRVGRQLVYRDNVVLSPQVSQAIYNHSPDGFNWGHGGSGPAQLALALLYDVTNDKRLSCLYYQIFKWQFVAGWGDQWSISSDQISAWLKVQEVMTRYERAYGKG